MYLPTSSQCIKLSTQYSIFCLLCNFVSFSLLQISWQFWHTDIQTYKFTRTPFFRRPITHLPTNLNRLRTRSNANREKQYNFFLADFSKLSYDHYVINTFCPAKGWEFCSIVWTKQMNEIYLHNKYFQSSCRPVGEINEMKYICVFCNDQKWCYLIFFYILSTHEHGRFILSVNLSSIFQSYLWLQAHSISVTWF